MELEMEEKVWKGVSSEKNINKKKGILTVLHAL